MLPGTMHHVNTAATGLCQSRQRPGLTRGTPQIQHRVSAPRLQPRATWPRRRKGWLFNIQWGLPGVLTSRTLPSPPPPSSFLVCMNY